MKVSIIGGGGLVGSCTGFALQAGGIVREIALVDANAELAEGQALDLLHGSALVADQTITAGGYEHIPDSDLICITAGLRRKPDESRLDLINRNTDLFLSILGEVAKAGYKKDAVVLVVSNPVDVLTYLAVKRLDLPSSQVPHESSTPMSQAPPIVLTFAATDPSGGAGLQADILTLQSMGCHALSVVTAVTVQDTVGVEDVMPLDAEWVADQARCVLEDMPVSVFKIGLLGSVEIIAAIAEVISDYPEVPLVLDPVLSSGRGDELATDDMLAAMRELLIPQTTLITPNSLEARRLAIDDSDDSDDPSLEECARRILTLGCEYVLITGTHENTQQVVNILYSQQGVVRSDSWQRLPGTYHGSGCTLASAIAATIANGLPISEAVRDAQEYTWQTLSTAYRPGMGQQIPDRLFWAREEDAEDEEKPET
jgi:hydroxymethylpyrimidine/phosphomethylpyrimidine kinase